MTTTALQHDLNAFPGGELHEADIRFKIRDYMIKNLLVGSDEELDDAASLTMSGIVDSAAVLELLAFLSEEFAITIADTDLTLANLDSVDGMVALVERNLVQA